MKAIESQNVPRLPVNQDPDSPEWIWRTAVPYNDEDGGDCIVTIDEFSSMAAVGALTDDDGFGECMLDGHVSNVRIYPSNLDRPSWTTHVCWYNK